MFLANINFKKKSFWENLPDILSADVSIGGKGGKNSSEKKSPFNINISTVQIKSWLTRGLSGVLILSIAYIGIATYINGQLKKKNEEAQQVENQIKAQISAMDTDKKKVDSKASEYATLTTNLRNATNQINDKNSYKNVIPTVLSEIMYTIPVEVQLTSIENTSDRKIVINAQSTKYEQLAYFKALLKSRGVLKPTSVVSSEAVKEGSIVKIVIEGELP
jgi:Tfp pilus assembly protein PilN